MIPIDDDDEVAFEDDEPEAGDPFPDTPPPETEPETEPEDDIEYQEDDYPEGATDEGAPGITEIMTSTAPEGEQVSEADVPANAGKPGAYIAMPGGKRVRAT